MQVAFDKNTPGGQCAVFWWNWYQYPDTDLNDHFFFMVSVHTGDNQSVWQRENNAHSPYPLNTSKLQRRHHKKSWPEISKHNLCDVSGEAQCRMADMLCCGWTEMGVTTEARHTTMTWILLYEHESRQSLSYFFFSNLFDRPAPIMAHIELGIVNK